MKRMQSWRWIPTALLVAVGGTTLRSEEFAITSFSGTGQLVFNTLNDGTNYAYRVEWAPAVPNHPILRPARRLGKSEGRAKGCDLACLLITFFFGALFLLPKSTKVVYLGS